MISLMDIAEMDKIHRLESSKLERTKPGRGVVERRDVGRFMAASAMMRRTVSSEMTGKNLAVLRTSVYRPAGWYFNDIRDYGVEVS